MGICSCEAVGQEAVYIIDEVGGSADRRVPSAGCRQRSLGTFNSEAVRRKSLRSIGESGEAQGERLKTAGPRQHLMGICGSSLLLG